MQSEDLRAMWADYNRGLAESMRLNTVLLQRTNLATTETSLGKHRRGIGLELAFNAVAILLLGSFAAGHIGQPKFVVPAVILALYAIALIASGVWQIVHLSAFDYDEPVIALQTRLERYRAARSRIVQFTLLLAPAMWAPLLIVLLKGLFGVDAFAAMGLSYILANALFGVALVPLVLWVARRYGARLRANTFVRTLADDLTGRSLMTALSSLDTLRRFADE